MMNMFTHTHVKILETIFNWCVLGVKIINLEITYMVLFLKLYGYFVDLL